MIAIKTFMKELPKYCEDCTYYSCRPHPMRGWSELCELCGQRIDDDQDKDWLYGGNGRPKNCPLIEVKVKEIPNEVS